MGLGSKATITILALTLVGCSDSKTNNKNPVSNQKQKVTVQTNVTGGNGEIYPTTQVVDQGNTARFTISPKENYKISSVSGCNGKLTNNTYVTDILAKDCSITANFSPLSPPEQELVVDVAFLPNLKNLSKDWGTKFQVKSESELIFSGKPSLSAGEVFILNDRAYKVEKLAGDTTGNTIVNVTSPQLNEVYSKIVLSGVMEEVEFIPSTELPPISASTFAPQDQRQRILAADVNQSTEHGSEFTEDGFLTHTFNMSRYYDKLYISTRGTLKIGAKFNFKEWDIISNTGHGTIDLLMNPSVIASLKPKSEEDKEDKEESFCSSDKSISKAGRFHFLTIPIGKTLIAIPGAYAASQMIDINIPVCLVGDVSSNAEFALMDLSGKYTTQITVGNSDSPKIVNNNNLSLALPPNSTKLPESTLSVGMMKSSLSGTINLGLEAGLEIQDKWTNSTIVGLNVAAMGETSLKGTFGLDLINKNLSSIFAEPKACLEFTADAYLFSRVYSKFFWDNKSKIKLRTPFPFFTSSFSKQFGLCQYNFINNANVTVIDNQKSDYTEIEVKGSDGEKDKIGLYCQISDVIGKQYSISEMISLNGLNKTATLKVEFDEGIRDLTGSYDPATGAIKIQYSDNKKVNQTNYLKSIKKELIFYGQDNYLYDLVYSEEGQTLKGNLTTNRTNSWSYNGLQKQCSQKEKIDGILVEADKI